jgi:hypothetical protein
MNQTSDIIFGAGMSYDQIVAILTRASIQNGSGFTITACAEFIHSVRKYEPEITDAFLGYIANKGQPTPSRIARDVEEALQPVIGGRR